MAPLPEREHSAARRYLHANLNTSDVNGLAAFLANTLGIRETMRSGSEDHVSDGAVLGQAGMVRSEAAFLYDARGPRTACAIELVQWYDPQTLGEPYSDPWHVGVQAVGYVVQNVIEVADRARDLGATDADGPPFSAVVGAPAVTLTMPGGARLDLVEGPGDASRIRHLRQNVTDLDRSIGWYEGIGFSVIVPPADAEVGGRTVRHAALQLPDEGQRLILVEVGGSDRAYVEPCHAGLFRSALAIDDPAAGQLRLEGEGLVAKSELHELVLEGTKVGHLQILIVRDPDGVMVEFVGRDRSLFR
jgi:catechol 2,3-dioxygenase-like lactoylglutathione lyase family enzyme